ncbi:hypothetical protein ABIC59_004589 [Priestia aryabhattai]|uniref:hypothetical protein n=1 Tax=Priestia aryabhattai TaxID=412384 RepID=UPI003390D64F
MNEEKPRLKNIYKKTLAMDLIKLGNDLHHTMRNKNNPKYQVYVFHDNEKLIQDLLFITRRNPINNRYENNKK